MTLTKTQINYLNEKLERECRDRVNKYRKTIGADKNIEQLISERVIKGKLKILSAKEIALLIKKTTDNGGWYRTIDIKELVNKEVLSTLEDELQVKQDKAYKYEEKIWQAKQNAMDMYVLGGVDIQTALKEFDKIDKEIDKE